MVEIIGREQKVSTRAFVENKQLTCKELCGGVPDAIIILSGGIIPSNQAKRDGRPAFKSPSYSEEYVLTDPVTNGEIRLITGGKARIISAAELARVFPNTIIVTTSAVDSNEPTHAAVMERELVDLGVLPNRILKEEVSWDTFSEMAEMVKMADSKGWWRLAVITNGYHVPRAQEMFNQAPSLISEEVDPDFHNALDRIEKGLKVVFVSAEDILPLRHRSYQIVIEAVKSSQPYSKRLEAEAKGLSDLNAGRYRFRPRKIF